MAEAPAAPVVPTAPAAPADPAPWYQGVNGVDQEMVGHWTNRGWHTKSAAEVAVEATKAWKGAEHLVGVPADQVIRLPKDPNDVAWKGVWQRLGTPKESKEYDFSAIKFSDGNPLDEVFVNSAREWAFKFNLPKDAAAGVIQEFAKFLDGAETSEKAETTAKLQEQQTALDKNWGPNKAANMFIAQRAAAALGVAPETVKSLEDVVGYDKIMDMFLSIGQKIGEDKFVTGTKESGGGPMTREQAVAKKADLMNDKLWVERYLKGDREAQREMTAINTIIVGVPKAA